MKSLIDLSVRYKFWTICVLLLATGLTLLVGYRWTLVMWSLIGVVINIYHYKACFAIWAVTNASWAIIDYVKGIPEQGVLFTVYFMLAIHGLIVWHRGGSK